MRKFISTFLAIIFTVSIGYSQVTTLWEKSQSAGTQPSWFDNGNLTRALAFGNNHVYIASRNGGSFTFIYNAATGDSIGVLSSAGISGGTYNISDVETSTDGKIFVCNLTVNASTDTFRVYRYDNESATPVPVIKYIGIAARLGDKFTVTGSTADNSIVIWAASANTNDLVKFTTVDNGNTFTASLINVGIFGGSASVGPLPNADFYYNAGSQNPKKFSATGTLIGTVPGTIVSTGSNSIRFLKTQDNADYFITYAFGAGNENGRIVRVPGGIPDSNTTLFAVTPTLGTNANTNGTGDVSVQQVSAFIYTVYVLSTNNGFGAYQVDLRPQLSGTYYVGAPGSGPGGSNPQYPSLRDAFQAINNSNITGDCIFYITSDITEVTTPGGLGLAVNPAPHTITFKPYTGVQPVITLPYTSDSNSGPSGAMVIGIPMENNIAWNDLRTTKNIVIDGSNLPAGGTRDLTITNLTNSVGNAFPVTIVGDVSNLTIKNCNILYKAQTTSTSNLFRAAIQLRGRLQNSLNWTPTNIIIENNYISTNFAGVSQGLQGIVTVALSPQPTTYMSGIVIRGNVIMGTQRAIALGWSGSTDIYNNGLVLNQSIAATTANQVIVAANLVAGSTVNIYDNRITNISSVSNGASAGNTGISIEIGGTFNIYNNMISGFNLTAANPTASLRGISVTSADATSNIYYNTIYMDNIPDIGTGVVAYNGIYLNNGTNDVKNNIVVSAETDFATYCINKTGTTGTLTSNYNNFYPVSAVNGNVGFWDAVSAPTLANWQTASGQDANSKSKQVFFVSATDLHLTGSSVGDLDLAGTPLAGITTDIDGDTRSTTFPYMGADEGSIPLPVELVSFAASVDRGDVILNWETATEINNRGFEIERSIGGEFTTVGFVSGAGTTTKKQTYTFTDKDAPVGGLTYRLKQVDFDGHYSYSNTIEVEVVSPLTFNLSQNYPNPFNPTTRISYSIPSDSKVVIAVYSITGEMVMELVNDFVSAGSYSVDFDGRNLASGMYIYKMTAGNFTQTNKMMLMK